MNMTEAQAWVLIIGTMTTGIAAIIGAVGAARNSKKADLAIAETKVLSKKSDEIHTIVNSSMTELRAKNDLLMSMMAAKDMEKVIAENARIALAAAAGTAMSAAATAAATTAHIEAAVAAVPASTAISIQKQTVEEQVVRQQVVEELPRIIRPTS